MKTVFKDRLKKGIIIVLTIMSIIVGCKAKQNATLLTKASMDDQLAAIQTRFPNATKIELQKGHDIYTGACTKCHKAKDITVYKEPKLLKIIDKMSKKAKLSEDEKQALIRFAIGVRATTASK
jgi:hypothetical protein